MLSERTTDLSAPRFRVVNNITGQGVQVKIVSGGLQREDRERDVVDEKLKRPDREETRVENKVRGGVRKSHRFVV